MVERLLGDAGGHVGQARQPQHAQPHVAGHDGLGDGRHAHRVGPHGAGHLDLGGRLVGGAREGDVDAAAAGHAYLPAGLLGDLAQLGVVDGAHVREARPQLVEVGPHQRVAAHVVDVVRDDHQLAGLVVDVDAAGGVGQHQAAHAQAAQHAGREGHLLERVALVVVHPAGHDRHRHAVGEAHHQLALVADRGRDGEVGDLAEGDVGGALQGLGEGPQPRAQHHADPRLQGALRADQPRGLLDLRQRAGGPAHSSAPAMQAVMKLAKVPARRALRPSRARSLRRSGASAPMPPIWMPIELKLAKPHRA